MSRYRPRHNTYTNTTPTPLPPCAGPDKAAKAENWEQGGESAKYQLWAVTRGLGSRYPETEVDRLVRRDRLMLTHGNTPSPITLQHCRHIQQTSLWCQEFNLYRWSIDDALKGLLATTKLLVEALILVMSLATNISELCRTRVESAEPSPLQDRDQSVDHDHKQQFFLDLITLNASK